MVHARCVSAAGIHLSRTWMSQSFESTQWNACVHRLDFGLYSYTNEFSEMESEPMLTPREKSSLLDGSKQGCIRDAALHRTVSPTHYWLSYSHLKLDGPNMCIMCTPSTINAHVNQENAKDVTLYHAVLSYWDTQLFNNSKFTHP